MYVIIWFIVSELYVIYKKREKERKTQKKRENEKELTRNNFQKSILYNL